MKMKSIQLIVILIVIQFISIFLFSRNGLASGYMEVSTGGTASASSYYSVGTSTYLPSYAFDTDTNSFWQSSNSYVSSSSPEWLRYDLNNSIIVTKYKIKSMWYYAPKTWDFQGFDGSIWVTLHSRSNEINWTSGETREFTFPNTNAYSSYRLYITDSNIYYYVKYVVIGDFELDYYSNYDCIIPSGTLTNTTYTCTGNFGSIFPTVINSGSTVTISASGIITLAPGFTATAGSTVDIFSGDANANGLPDWWETQYGGPNVDPDDDGISNFWEYMLGFNPNVANIDSDNDGMPDWYEIQQYGSITNGGDPGTCNCN